MPEASSRTGTTTVPSAATGTGGTGPHRSGPVAVRVEGVSKSFGGPGAPPVLEGIDLTIRKGEFVCLLGASGCGKSTLLSVLAGLEPATTGSVSLDGGAAALMFQEPALLPWLTAGRNVELALQLRGVPKRARRDRARELLEVVRLGGHEHSRVHELSGGMRQRVALARSLAQEREVLLMDEPFAALDAITRDLLHDELERVWHETGRTVVFVTHNVREAVRLGERVLLMSSRPGRVVREWQVDIVGQRRIETPAVSALAVEITDHLRREIRRHAA